MASALASVLLAGSAAFVGSAALVGCGGRTFTPATPPGFVDLGDIYGDDEYRAATADGVVLSVRAFKNEPKGETAFWAKALENRMREMGGYALLEKRTVKNRGGLQGTQLRFGHDEGKSPHIYVITLFTTDEHVYLLEAGGVKEEMTKMADQVDWSVTNFLQK